MKDILHLPNSIAVNPTTHYGRSNRIPHEENIGIDVLAIYERRIDGNVLNGPTAMLKSIHLFFISIMLTILFIVEMITKTISFTCRMIASVCTGFADYILYCKKEKPKAYVFWCIVIGFMTTLIIYLTLISVAYAMNI